MKLLLPFPLGQGGYNSGCGHLLRQSPPLPILFFPFHLRGLKLELPEPRQRERNKACYKSMEELKIAANKTHEQVVSWLLTCRGGLCKDRAGRRWRSGDGGAATCACTGGSCAGAGGGRRRRSGGWDAGGRGRWRSGHRGTGEAPGRRAPHLCSPPWRCAAGTPSPR